MSKINIVEYNPSYAKKVAEMWHRSSGQPGWNGEVFTHTEESVKKNEAKSSNLNLFLAETDDKIVGYCSLSEYREDIGALYIGLLNVEPDYMSKKIGKMLVLRSVERTIELGYPRLDLFTWGGNTKAVPLYKKTGFFWEEIDGGTHFMNFIPSVLKEELFKEYFDNVDWYNDSKRIIEVVPDGRKENKFEYYTYAWEKEGNKLEIDYERRGRGLRRIENNDYSIEAVVEDLELVFGSKYKVKYIIKNKSGKDLNISIKGMNDENIDFSMEENSAVDNEKTFTGEFFVNKINTKQNIWKTHPTIKSEIVINGIKTIFKVGVEPRIPLDINVHKKVFVEAAGLKGKVNVNIQNNFDKPTKFKFVMPNNDIVEFINDEIQVDLKANEKDSIELEYIVKKAGIYNPEINFTVQSENDKEFTYKKKILIIFIVENEKFVGKSESYYLLGNNKFVFSLNYNKDVHNKLNEAFLSNNQKNGSGFFFLTPKLGKPYVDEFLKKEAEKVEMFEKDNYVQLSAYYKSEKYDNLEFIVHFKLYANGKFVRWNEFIKSTDLNNNIFLGNHFWMNSENLYLPIDNKIIETNKRINNDLSYWQGSELTENWLYAFNKDFRKAIIWSKDTSLTIGEWNVGYEYEIPKEKGIFITDEEIFYCEAPNDWKVLRKIATGIDSKDEEPINSFDIMVNDGNPVMNSENTVTVKDVSKKIMNGDQIISAKTGSSDQNGAKIELTGDKDSSVVNFKYEKGSSLDIINIHSNFGAFEYFDKRLVINPTAGEVRSTNKNGCFTVDNGILSISSDEKFAPTLHSLKYENKEWLDTFYPEVGPKSWWGHWFGGLSILPKRIQNKKLLEQSTNAGIVKLEDNFGNLWTGIKITMEFTECEKCKGYSNDQYFMMLPGVPMLWVFTKVHNNTGKFLDVKVAMDMYAKASENVGDHYFIQPSTGYVFNPGKEMQGVKPEKLIIMSEKNRDEFVNVYSADNAKIGCHLNSEVCIIGSSNRFECANKESKLVGSKFIIFSDDKLKADWLVDLKKVKPII